MANQDITLKRNNAGTIDNLYPTTTWTQVENKPSTFTPTAHTLTSHSDVTITSPSTGQVLKYNGSAWVNDTDATGGGGGIDGSGTANQITYWVDADTLGSLTTATYPSLTELSRVKGVTSSIQTQINNKQDSLGTGTTDDFLRWGAFGAYWDAVTASDVGAAASSHTHGNISNGGFITSNTAPATGQHLMITSSGNLIQQSEITFDTNETTFLRRDGTWATPAGGGGGATILYDDSTTTLTVSTTTYATPTGTPELSLSAGKKYYVRCMGTYAASTIGTGLGLSAYFSTATGVTILGGKLMVMDTGTTSGVTSEDTAPWQSASSVPGGSANSMLATTGPGTTQTYFGFDGFVQTTSTATTLKIAFRTEVSATEQYIFDVAVYAVEVA